MNNKALIGVLALSFLVVSGSFVAPAVANSSEISGSADIETIINYIIHGGGDVAKVTEITKDPTDTRTFNLVPNTEDNYPASTITTKSKTDPDQNIVQNGQHFDIDVTIPQGVYYCFKIQIDQSLTVNNEITITSPDYKGTIALDSAKRTDRGTFYIGVSGGSLEKRTDAPTDTWVYWIYSQNGPTTIHLGGDVASGILSWNLGDLKVHVLMKSTPTQ